MDATTTPASLPIASASLDEVSDKVAAEGYRRLVSALRSIHRPEHAQGFYALLMEISSVCDEAGNPKIDPDTGEPVTDGSVGRLIYHTGMLFLSKFEDESKLKASDGEPGVDPELADAVRILFSRAFSGPVPTSEGAVHSCLPEAQSAGEGL